MSETAGRPAAERSRQSAAPAQPVPPAQPAQPAQRLQPRTGAALRELATVLFGEHVQLPRIRHVSMLGKVLLAACAATVLAGMVLLVSVSTPSAQQPTWMIAAAEVIAPLGLLAGCSLVLHASRDYLLGLPGVVVSVFVTILLATFAVLTLYLTGFAPATIAGVTTSPARQHLAVALALAGVLAAFLLIPAPWSPYRKVAQPGLVTTAVLAPVLALLCQEGPRAFLFGFPSLPGLLGDPILLVASVGGLLAIPLVVAGSIEWVSGCVAAGFRLEAQLSKRHRAGLRAGLIVAVLAWLALGVSGALPEWLGGHLGAWPLIRDAHPDAWILAVAVTGSAALFVARGHGRLDLPEATSAAYIPTGLLFYSSVAVSLWIFFQAGHFLLEEILPAAVPDLVVCIGVFAVAAAALWFAPGLRRRPVAVLAGLAACCATLVVTGFRWPSGVLPNQIASEFPFGPTNNMGTVLDSATMLAAAAGIIALLAFGAWFAFWLWARSIKATNFDGTPATQTGYETVVLPLAFWSVLLLAGSLLRMRGGLLLSAFAHPVLPDPVVFTVVAVPVAAVVALSRRHVRPELAQAALCVVLVMPVLAFVPFLVPSTVGTAGRLAVLALAAPIVYGLTFGGRDLNRDGGTERRLGWLAGTSAIVVPLLAYLLVVGHVRGSLTSLLTDNGQTGNAGLGAHLRLLLLLPLFLTFVMARPKPIGALRGRDARSRALQADVLALYVRDHDLDTTYLDPLRRHLAAASPHERVSYACRLAERLSCSYSPPRHRPATTAPDGHRPAPGYPRPQSVAFALDVARQRMAGRAPSPHDLARARSLVDRRLPTPPPEDRGAVRAYDTVSVLRCALSGDEGISEDCLDTLVAASRHEVEDAAAPYLADPESERNLERMRTEIDAQLMTLTDFEFYEGASEFVRLAPAMVLNDPPGIRKGTEPSPHPYRFLAVVLLVVGLVTAIAYIHIAGVPR
jgi:hypothetical protein